MSDGETGAPQWQPPVDPSAPAYGATPAYGAAPHPTPDVPGQPAGAGQQWTPPPRPGLIPLHPLTLGTLLSASFRAFRRNPRPTLGLALLSQFGVLLLSAGFGALVAWFAFSRIDNASSENVDDVTAGAILGLVIAYIVPIIASGVVAALLQGVVVIEVARAAVGEKLGLRQLWRHAKGRLWALIGWMLLLVVAMLIAMGVLAAAAIALGVTLGAVGIALGVTIGILGGLGLLVLGVWLGTKVSLVPSALMIERLRLGAAIRRSWRLTDGHFWRTFGTQALVSVILGIAVQVIVTPVSLVLPMLSLLIDPNGTANVTAIVVIVAFTLVMLALIVVLGSIAAIIQSSANGLIYIDLRMRKEGLDLDLARYVDDRAAGAPTADDPYLPQSATQQQATDAGTIDSPWR
ncbi:membrane-anchored glycerophosphoryl diester phosphodiesterase (GDPDase) [Homoserinimonas aerilata]|uniref:Membrane-anchored glycerophosphoryl diester phosphodiesterase (GDPDase) n=1 Tax=Homoserinimonas aerilata TaxID=1162970 RepID=A0A542YKG7_9MICO|nr:hypothetical protein [Homoserinimonas aerilata]TQL48596.1 membrane-anchored glycerophosphoryl diester phosphodiesterase (GDPDase) [Homoserinimonas aerilata]